jgi:hypothetical protein
MRDYDDDRVSVVDLDRRPVKAKRPQVRVVSLPQEHNAFIHSSDDEGNPAAQEEEIDMYDMSARRGYLQEDKQGAAFPPESVMRGYVQAKYDYDSPDEDSYYRQSGAADNEARPSNAGRQPVTNSRPKQGNATPAAEKSTRYVVTVVSKRVRDNERPHPWEKRINSEVCFAVNGVRGKTLFLRRGNTYYFEIKQKSDNKNGAQHLYFTTDPMGGGKSGAYDPTPMEGSPEPTANGVVCYKVTSNTPKLFYYQSRSSPMLGGTIVVKD